MTRFRRTLVVAASELLLLAGVTATGSATPGTGVSDTILAKGTSPNGIVVGSRGNTEVAVREITIAPGGSTGWHYHEGALIAVVKSGTLTRTLHDCSTEQTLPGGSFVEPAGRTHVHIGAILVPSQSSCSSPRCCRPASVCPTMPRSRRATDDPGDTATPAEVAVAQRKCGMTWRANSSMLRRAFGFSIMPKLIWKVG